MNEVSKQSARVIFEALAHGDERFEDFLRRPPLSPNDLEVWQALDDHLGDGDLEIRRRYLEAGEARRCQQRTLEDYLRCLEKSCRLSQTQLAAIAGVSEALWTKWLLAEEDIIPGLDPLRRLVSGVPLSSEEARFLCSLRDETVRRSKPRLQPGLGDYLRTEPRSLGPALAKTRSRKGFSVDQVAAQANLPAELWQRWEEGEIPCVAVLDAALKLLHWIWATDDALRDWKDEIPAPRDAKLWKAFLNDHEWDESGSQELWLLPLSPTPEAIEAWKQVKLAREAPSQPDPHSQVLSDLADQRKLSERSIAAFLRFRRKARGVTIEEMACKAGVDLTLWLAWESGDCIPSLEELQELGPRIFVTPSLREKLLEIWHKMHADSKVRGAAPKDRPGCKAEPFRLQ